MFSNSNNAKPADEKFIITQKEKSICYELNNPKELKAIEISDDLYRAKFYFSVIQGEQKEQSYELAEENRRIRGIVSSAVYPPLPEIGHVCKDSQCIEIYGMKDYSVMPSCNRDHIKETFCIDEQLHPLEWILTKARNSGILSNTLYQTIRVDVRNRVKQMQEIAKINEVSFNMILNEVSNKYSNKDNFKKISNSSDTSEFAGQVIAYRSDSYYLANGNNAIIFPNKASGQEIRFAKVSRQATNYSCGEQGYNMSCFLKPEACGSTHALINSQIHKDKNLAMRLATIQELEFLKLTLELNQGRLEYGEKENDIKMLTEKIALESKTVTPPGGLNISQSSIFTPKKSATISLFKHLSNGVIDWNTQNENKDKSNPSKPSKVYLIRGGDEQSRKDKAYNLARQDNFAMYGVYDNKDKSEIAIVFSYDHDTFNLMSFEKAKEFAGQEQLPESFTAGTFGNKAQYGVITLTDVAPRYRI